MRLGSALLQESSQEINHVGNAMIIIMVIITAEK